MDCMKIFLAIIVSTLLVASVCAAGVNDFKVDKSFTTNAFTSGYYSVYINDNHDSGIAIYRNENNDAYDELNDEVIGHLVYDDGNEYLVGDSCLQLTKNANNTANFTDLDHSEHGVVEIVQSGSDQYIVVLWAKDSSSIATADLMSKLMEFNKDNNVSTVAF